MVRCPNGRGQSHSCAADCSSTKFGHSVIAWRFRMLIVHGIYRWRPKKVAFHNDYCLTCGKPRRSVCIRTFDAWHIFWVPVLPLGFWKHWFCAACGRDPHVLPRTRRSFKWAGLIVLIFLSILFWAAPVTPDFVVGSWVFRLGAPVAAVLLLVHLLRSDKDPSLKEKLAAVPPATETICPFCTTPMVGGGHWSCPGCGVERN